jgi:hypothetical protein
MPTPCIFGTMSTSGVPTEAQRFRRDAQCRRQGEGRLECRTGAATLEAGDGVLRDVTRVGELRLRQAALFTEGSKVVRHSGRI